MRIGIVLSVMIVGLASPTTMVRAAVHTKDSLDEVKKAVTEGKAVLLDVREKSEWDEGHLKDAKLLPLSELKGSPKAEDVARVAPKGKIVYCHCGSGIRSLKSSGRSRKTRL